MTDPIPREGNTNSPNSLSELREQIDAIDAKLLNLINQRLEVGRAVGNLKQQCGAQVLDRSREKSLMEELLRINQGPATEQQLRYIFNVIITATREIQKPKKIAFPGVSADHSHIAALAHFKHSGTFIAQPTLHEVFSQVDKGLSQYGVVPVENSMEGAVSHTLDLFVDFEVSICGEHYETISHDLLSLTGDPGDIYTICGPQRAMAQCRNWIHTHFPHVSIKEESSWARAAALASQDSTVAAIGTRQAAHLYNLFIVESRIEDIPGNITRFLILGKESSEPTGNDKTSVMFATSHVPGALFKALAPVEKAGLNMLKLESRPIRDQKWSYYFFLDVAGHRRDKNVAAALAAMEEVTLSLKVLGTYPAAGEKIP